MEDLLCIRLFFAFVPRSAREGKRRIFHPRYERFLFKVMPHCAQKSRARQSECLCIASEISAKLFFAISAESCSVLAGSSAPQYVSVSARGASKFWA